MAINLGDKGISDIKLGSTNIASVYKGDELIWPINDTPAYNDITIRFWYTTGGVTYNAIISNHNSEFVTGSQMRPQNWVSGDKWCPANSIPSSYNHDTMSGNFEQNYKEVYIIDTVIQFCVENSRDYVYLRVGNAYDAINFSTSLLTTNVSSETDVDTSLCQIVTSDYHVRVWYGIPDSEPITNPSNSEGWVEISTVSVSRITKLPNGVINVYLE